MKFKIIWSIFICTGSVLLSVASARRSHITSTVQPQISNNPTYAEENQSSETLGNQSTTTLEKQSTTTLENQSNGFSTVYPNRHHNPTSAVFHQSNDNSRHGTHTSSPTSQNQSNGNARHSSNLRTASTENESVDTTTVQPNMRNTLHENQSNGNITDHRNNSTESTESTENEDESDDSEESSKELNVPSNPSNDTSTENESHNNETHGSIDPTVDPTDQDTINSKGKFVAYEIYAKIDNKLAGMVKEIEKHIRSSDLRSFIPLPRSTYHMKIYTIYNSELCSQIIPPIEQWYNATNRTIPSVCSKIPYEALEEQNNAALCLLKKDLNKPLKIKYATLNIGTANIFLTLEFEIESFQRIQNVRRVISKIYDHPDKSLEPIFEKLHIQLAYGRRNKINMDDLNKLNILVRPFIGAKLALPSVYLDNGNRYIEFQGNTDCSSYDFSNLY